MSKRFVSLSASAALILGAVVISARAEEPAVHGAKTVGALTLESRGLAIGPRDVIRQGGLATAGTARWVPAPAEAITTAAFTGAGTVGALRLETLGLATSASGVHRQGGAFSARAVRWTSAPAK